MQSFYFDVLLVFYSLYGILHLYFYPMWSVYLPIWPLCFLDSLIMTPPPSKYTYKTEVIKIFLKFHLAFLFYIRSLIHLARSILDRSVWRRAENELTKRSQRMGICREWDQQCKCFEVQRNLAGGRETSTWTERCNEVR